jgi:hypothetical protein
MSLESGSFLNDLVASNPVGSQDNVSQGDDHIRLIKTLLKASFPNITKATYLQQAREDVASAATCNIGAVASDNVRITGTTTITSFGTVGAGTMRFVQFAAALTLTHHATNLILPGARDITTAAGDSCLALSLGSGAWKVLFYERQSGVPPGFTIADQAAMEAASSLLALVTAGRQLYHPTHPKKWGNVMMSGATPTLVSAYGISSVSRPGEGRLTVNFDGDMADTNYCVITTPVASVNAISIQTKSTSSMELRSFEVDQAVSLSDPSGYQFMVLGDM